MQTYMTRANYPVFSMQWFMHVATTKYMIPIKYQSHLISLKYSNN